MHHFNHFNFESFLPMRLIYNKDKFKSGSENALNEEIARLKAEKSASMTTDGAEKGDIGVKNVLDQVEALEAAGEEVVAGPEEKSRMVLRKNPETGRLEWQDMSVRYIRQERRDNREARRRGRRSSGPQAPSTPIDSMIASPEEIPELSWEEKRVLEFITAWEPTTLQRDHDFFEALFEDSINNSRPVEIKAAVSSAIQDFDNYYFGKKGITENLSEADKNYLLINRAAIRADKITLDVEILRHRNREENYDDLAFEVFKSCRETSEIINSLPVGLRGEYGVVDDIVYALAFLSKNFEDYDLNKPNSRDIIDNLKDRGHGEIGGVSLGEYGYDNFPLPPQIPEAAKRLENFQWSNLKFDSNVLTQVYDAEGKKAKVDQDPKISALLAERANEFSQRYPMEMANLSPKQKQDLYTNLALFSSSNASTDVRAGGEGTISFAPKTIENINHTLDYLDLAVDAMIADGKEVEEDGIASWHRSFERLYGFLWMVEGDSEGTVGALKLAKEFRDRADGIKDKLYGYEKYYKRGERGSVVVYEK